MFVGLSMLYIDFIKRFLTLQAEPLRVCVTGAAGQIAYSLLYAVAKGDIFGPNQVTNSNNT